MWISISCCVDKEDIYNKIKVRYQKYHEYQVILSLYVDAFKFVFPLNNYAKHMNLKVHLNVALRCVLRCIFQLNIFAEFT